MKTKKAMLFLAISISFLMLPFELTAGESTSVWKGGFRVSNAKVTKVRVRKDGLVVFHLDKKSNNTLPNCASLTQKNNEFVIDAKNSKGSSAQLATLLSVAAAGKPISLIGLGNCNLRPGIETVFTIIVDY